MRKIFIILFAIAITSCSENPTSLTEEDLSLEINDSMFLFQQIDSSNYVGYTQEDCPVLNYIQDTIQINGITVVYKQKDSIVNIQYGNSFFTKTLPAEYSFHCQTKYTPSIPRPKWANNEFIEFSQSGGTSVFSSFVAPLNLKDSVQEAGQYLIDSTQTIFMSLYLGSTFERLLEIKNCKTGENQIITLDPKDFWTAAVVDCLEEFKYKNKVLTLFYTRENETKIRCLKFNIKI